MIKHDKVVKFNGISMVLQRYYDQGTNKTLVWLIDVLVTLLILFHLEVILFLRFQLASVFFFS